MMQLLKRNLITYLFIWDQCKEAAGFTHDRLFLATINTLDIDSDLAVENAMMTPDVTSELD